MQPYNLFIMLVFFSQPIHSKNSYNHSAHTSVSHQLTTTNELEENCSISVLWGFRIKIFCLLSRAGIMSIKTNNHNKTFIILIINHLFFYHWQCTTLPLILKDTKNRQKQINYRTMILHLRIKSNVCYTNKNRIFWKQSIIVY